MACESCLKGIRAQYVESDIWPSVVNVIDRLLSRPLELVDVYAELHRQLPDAQALDMLFDAVLMTAAFYNQDKINEARDARDQLKKTNADIARVAHQLVGLLHRRDDLCNTSAFYTGERHSIVDLIEEASESNPLFKAHLQERLETLQRKRPPKSP